MLKSSKHESITFPDEFVFMFVPYFVVAISSKIDVKSGGWEKSKKGWPYREARVFL